jgi:ABC-2 type transport system ATP-binding protein
MLDEPANGLDPAGIVEIRNLLLSLAREQGVTIFVSSHILGEVSRLATRLGIIHQGRLIQEIGVDELKRIPRGRHKTIYCCPNLRDNMRETCLLCVRQSFTIR